jgi:hypothetical protein
MELINTTTGFTPLTTTTMAPETIPAYIGYIALSVSVFFLGTNFLPVKQYETGDGMFYQLVLTTGIWTVGFFVYWIRNFPQFYALPMLGGLFWSTGCLTLVPIIKFIGIGMGTLFWNTVLLVIGWGVARFGLLGVKPEIPSNSTLNYLGVAFAALSGVFYLFVKTESNKKDDENLLINNQESDEIPTTSSSNSNDRNSESYLDRVNPNTKRVAGIVMACVAGILYGFTFTPALYVQDNYENASKNALDYVFSLYTGIFISSVGYFAIYCLIKRNRPIVYANLFLPALVSGIYLIL